MTELKLMVDAGKATAGAPLGPALGPTGVNIGEVVAQINAKTESLAGMKVPITLTINKDKTFEIKVGLPPISALITKEAKVTKGAGNPKTGIVGNITIDQVIKIGETKYDVLNAYNKKAVAKEVMGSCNSVGVTVEGMRGKDAIKALNEGKFDEHFK